jgi:hypothetical protein
VGSGALSFASQAVPSPWHMPVPATTAAASVAVDSRPGRVSVRGRRLIVLAQGGRRRMAGVLNPPPVTARNSACQRGTRPARRRPISLMPRALPIFAQAIATAVVWPQAANCDPAAVAAAATPRPVQGGRRSRQAQSAVTRQAPWAVKRDCPVPRGGGCKTLDFPSGSFGRSRSTGRFSFIRSSFDLIGKSQTTGTERGASQATLPQFVP